MSFSSFIIKGIWTLQAHTLLWFTVRTMVGCWFYVLLSLNTDCQLRSKWKIPGFYPWVVTLIMGKRWLRVSTISLSFCGMPQSSALPQFLRIIACHSFPLSLLYHGILYIALTPSSSFSWSEASFRYFLWSRSWFPYLTMVNFYSTVYTRQDI